MSEKTMATIDNRLIISEGSEKVFENQYIRLEAGIERKGTLILRNSTIEPCAKLGSKNGRNPVCKPGCITMGIDGKLEMDGCKVIRPDQDFLSSWNMAIKNTSFLISPCPDTGIRIQSVLAPCVIAAHGRQSSKAVLLLDAPMLVVQKSAVLPLLIAEAFHPRTRAATLETVTLSM